MRALVTGGGGFLGLHLVRKLVAQGHTVTNLSRGVYPELQELGVRCIRGAITDKEVVNLAVQSQDVVFHVASKVAMWGRYSDFFDTNVRGTHILLEACKLHGIDKFIYTSTPSVVFADQSIENGNESLPYPKNSYSNYAITKALAEEEVLKANSENFKTISLRPHLVFGPGDQNLIPRLVESARKKKLKIIGDGDNLVDILYVENAADAHLCALDTLFNNPSYPGGRAYFIGQGPVKLWPFINTILIGHGLGPIEKKVSFRTAFIIGAVIEFFLKLFRIYDIHPPMTRFVALQLAKGHYFDHRNAEEDLGWTPKVSIEEALKRI